MNAAYNPGDGFTDDSEFDSVFEHTVPSARIPLEFNGVSLVLTPANAAVRLFFGKDLDDYSRAIVYLDDGTSAPLQPGGDFLQTMVNSGFPVELPAKLDETDQEFMHGRMHVWTEDAYVELDELQ